jgi:hypothetical protein
MKGDGMSGHDLHWSHGSARILTTAAMLADCVFHLGGREFRPFARAPWMDADPQGATGHLAVLGGDFACLPFGIGRDKGAAPPDWAAVLSGPTPGPIHGPAAEEEWTVLEASDHAIRLGLDYPAGSPVLRVERSIVARADAPALDCAFTIHARRRASMSAGLHPILRLPDQPGRLQLSAEFDFGLTHPGYGATEFADLSQVGLNAVPLSPRRDLNAQLCGMRGPLRAIWLDEGMGVTLDWDRALLPSLQIWHTDGGISGPPWQGAYRGIGVEPIASAFDLDTTVSCNPNPINRRGVATCLQIDPAAPVTIRHSITAFAV